MNDAAQRRLLDRLRPDTPRTGRVRRLLATTHNLQAEFFDSDFLCTVLSIAQMDFAGHSGQLALQRKLAELEYSGVLCEARAYEQRPSLRTVVHPVTLRGACLHAKLVVVEYEHAVRLLVGSANLTAGGYRHNREVSGELLAYHDDPQQAAQVASSLRSARDVLAPFADRAEEFLSELGRVLERVESWAASAPQAPSPVVWSDAAHPLWRTFLDRWPTETPVERIRIVSPFWCEDGTRDTPLRRLLNELRKRKALGARCAVDLYAESAQLADGSFAVKKPPCVYYADFPGVAVRVIPVSPKVDPADLDTAVNLAELRMLHAKLLVLQARDRALAYAGSANFTRNGFGLRRGAAGGGIAAANVEAGWVFDLAPAAVAGLLPPAANAGERLPSLEHPLDVAAGDEEPLETGFWPDTLLTADLAPASDSDSLALNTRWAAGTPNGWRVHAPTGNDTEASGALLLTTTGGAATVMTPLAASALQDILRHRHVVVVNAEDHKALFPVNVAAGEARHRLPLSPAGVKPGESELLQYYQGRLTFEDLYPPPDDSSEGDGPTEGPGRQGSRVDKSRIQAYQIREFVDALPGIERELLAARGSAGALYQAFRGEVSPVALAQLVVKQVSARSRSVTAGAFQLAELTAMLRSVAAKAPVDVEHYADECQLALHEVESKLELLRAAHPQELRAASGFGRYTERLKAVAS